MAVYEGKAAANYLPDQPHNKKLTITVPLGNWQEMPANGRISVSIPPIKIKLDEKSDQEVEGCTAVTVTDSDTV